jgi:AcrR family transcriptional regulator
MLMAKKARAKSSARAKTARPSKKTKNARAAAPSRDSIIDAMMMLLATRDYTSVSLDDIAEEAGISPAELREIYDGKLAILADFSRRIDQIVLDEGPAEGDSARDRLFEILMGRLDALAPYKDAVKNLIRAIKCDPGLACFAHRGATRSAKSMLAAADAGNSGLFGALARQGLVLVNGEALRVWLRDDDPGLAKTMAELDRALGRGEQAMRFAGGVCAALKPFLCRDRARGGETKTADA